jgi:hypothetical protein
VLDADSAAKATSPRWYAFWVPSNAGLYVVIARLRNYPERIERDHADARLQRPTIANAAYSQTLFLRATDLLPFTTRGETDMHGVMVSGRDGQLPRWSVHLASARSARASSASVRSPGCPLHQKHAHRDGQLRPGHSHPLHRDGEGHVGSVADESSSRNSSKHGGRVQG